MRKKSPPPREKERWRFIWALPSDEYHKKERIGVTAVARELSLYESQLYNGLSKQQNQQASSERKLEISTEIARLKRQLAERNEELVILQKAAAYFAKRQKLKYVFIEKHHAEFSIKAMCNVVLAAFIRSKQRYDAPRLTDVLRAQGYYFNVKTVAASLRRQGLRAKASRKFSPVNYRAHGLPVSENLLEQDFYASGPNQKWRETSRTYVQMKAGCIWQWSLTCGHVASLAGQCRHA